jgi:hypothetical protein
VAFARLGVVLESTFAKKPQVVKVNVEAARLDYAAAHFQPLSNNSTNQSEMALTGNELMAMGAAFAGCKFYCAYR